MIVPMIKYDFVLFHDQQEAFLERLQELGMVDITTRGWEPNDSERELMLLIERRRAAAKRLRELAAEDNASADCRYSDGGEAFEEYARLTGISGQLEQDIAQLDKEIRELKVWGEFDPAKISNLESDGIHFHYFSIFTKELEKNLEQWNEQFTIVPISEQNGITYFVVVTGPDTEVAINAQQMRRPEKDYLALESELADLNGQLETVQSQIKELAPAADLIETSAEVLQEDLQISKVNSTKITDADDSLVIMEGWATKETADNVEAVLSEQPYLYYEKSSPTPDDETPVLLKNNAFARLFEFIGNFYSLPKYGTMDLTAWFAPFYMLFFGLCLADAGYGLIYIVAGTFMVFKVPKLKNFARLVILCGISTTVCGFMMGSLFGIQLAELPAFVNFRDNFLSTDNLFYIALGLGLFQILFGMTLKVVSYTQQFGFKYALATLGWMIVILTGLGAFLLPESYGFGGSIGFWALIGLGVFMMLFLNSPGKNPLVNLGAGLWNTYNNVTGFLSDFLSYIRLFAIGLSGGILALVFNDLAFGLSPDIPGLRFVVILLILLIGHGINLFMSTLSSFVHPMRLTFVEFYNNAGFETNQRAFDPIRKKTNNN